MLKLYFQGLYDELFGIVMTGAEGGSEYFNGQFGAICFDFH